MSRKFYLIMGMFSCFIMLAVNSLLQDQGKLGALLTFSFGIILGVFILVMATKDDILVVKYG